MTKRDPFASLDRRVHLSHQPRSFRVERTEKAAATCAKYRAELAAVPAKRLAAKRAKDAARRERIVKRRELKKAS